MTRAYLWRACPSFPDYEVNEIGQVRRAISGLGASVGKLLQPQIDERGRHRYFLRSNKATKPRFASRLVCEAWWGAPPFDGALVCHNDSNYSNNHYRNLRWDTQKGNMADRTARGAQRDDRGEKHPMAKLRIADVEKIKAVYLAGGITQRELATRYGIQQSQVSRIVRGARWAE